MADDRLFKGQIRPAAQPIGSFINPAQFNTPNAANRPSIGRVSQIATIQRAGTTNVAGFNQAEQIAKSLGAFNRELTKMANTGLELYAQNQIDAGYNEELKNAQVRASLVLQEQQEMGAQQAAEQQTALAKVDPIGASLLREANPWKAIGRRRALAQMAAAEVSSVLNADLALNAGELSGIAPGSAALLSRKAALSQQVLNKYGLNGSEPESIKYVTPSMNRGWDKYTQRQSEMFTAEVYRSSVSATGAAITATAQKLGSDGVTLPDGRVLKAGDPQFAEAAGYMLTGQIDRGLAVLAGEDKTKAMKEIRQNLGLLRSMNIPGLSQAIDNIRVGSSRVPMDQRPRWIDANPYELMDFTNSALQKQNTNYEQSQQLLEQRLDQMWNGPDGPASLPYGSEEWKQRVQQIEGTGRDMNYRGIEEYIDRRSKDEESFETSAYAPDEQSLANWEYTLNNLTPLQLEDGGTALRQMAKDMAQAEPTPELRLTKLQEYNKKISDAQKRFAGLPKNSDLRSQVGRFVREDLGDPAIAKLKGQLKMMAGPLGQLYLERQGGGAPTASEQKFQQFANTVRDLHTREAFAQFQQWRNDNGGAEIPVNVQSTLLQKAAKEVRKSDEYKAARNAALGLDKNGVAPPKPRPVNKDPKQGPVPELAAPSIGQAEAKQYKDKAVMSPGWVHRELKSLQTGNSTSADLFRVSRTAGVLPERYLMEQLKFYPELDPTGGIRAFLQGVIDDKKAGSTPATTYGDQSSTPRSPGAWLNGLVMPVEITRLPGGEQGPAQGPYTPVKRTPDGWTPEGREPAPVFQSPIKQA